MYLPKNAISNFNINEIKNAQNLNVNEKMSPNLYFKTKRCFKNKIAVNTVNFKNVFPRLFKMYINVKHCPKNIQHFQISGK